MGSLKAVQCLIPRNWPHFVLPSDFDNNVT